MNTADYSSQIVHQYKYIYIYDIYNIPYFMMTILFIILQRIWSPVVIFPRSIIPIFGEKKCGRPALIMSAYPFDFPEFDDGVVYFWQL